MSLQDRVIRLDDAKHSGKTRELSAVNLIVIHATASGKTETAKSVIGWMNGQPNPISYHYMIDRDGMMYRMTKPELVAYHAGDSAFPNPVRATPANPNKPNGGKSVNGRSLGIAFVNNNHAEALTALQVESGEWLCHFWMKKLGLGPESVVTHAEVSPGRKTDPRAMPGKEWRAFLADNVPVSL